jgi:hypothetical protein
MATGYENLFGTEGQSKAFSRFGPQFQQQNDDLLRNILSQLGNNTKGFEPIENQARQDFQQKTIPTIAERFTTLGNGAISSPAYQAQQYGAGAQFETGLQALKSQYGMQNNNQLMQLLQLLSPEQAYFPGQPGALEGAARGISEGLPSYLGAQGLDNEQDQGWNWQNGLNSGGNALLAAAPFLSAIPGIGPFLTAGAGLVGGGLKIGSKFANNGQKQQPQNYNAQFNPMQQQLMNLGASQSYNSPFAGKLDINQGLGKLKPLGAL